MVQAHAHAAAHNFQTPIDEIDAAARVLDPIFCPALAAELNASSSAAATGSTKERPPASDSSADDAGKLLFGRFFKDYHETEW